MSIRTALFQSLGLVGLTLTLMGCGAGEDPLDLIDPTQDSITVSLPFTYTETNATFTGAFTSSAPYFTWTLVGFAANQANVLAPAAGLVTRVHQANNVYDVTIRVNSRFSVKVGAMTALGNVREGDLVSAGSNIGTTTTSVTLAVLEDGEETCPLPHLNDEAHNVVTTLTAMQVCL